MPKLYNGTFNNPECDIDGLDYNEVCQPTCETGYYLQGDGNFRCDEFGQWTSSNFAQCISRLYFKMLF